MNTAAPMPIPVRELFPAVLAAAFAMLIVYLTQFDQGAISQTGSFVHELMHDGRHLLGVPCH